MSKGKYYLTTAIAYTSGKPHIGNTYEIILSDAIARYRRKQGYDVFFQTGTDEHGQKIERNAALANKTPQEFVDGIVEGFYQLWDFLDISNNDFIRTTQERHWLRVQEIFTKLLENFILLS